MPKTPRRCRSKYDTERLLKLYNKRARQWGECYITRNLWRIKGMYDRNDVKQDAFFVFLRVYRNNPGRPEAYLFRIYKAGIRGRLINRAKECFPNTFAYVEGKGKLVLDIDNPAVLDKIGQEATFSLDCFSHLFENLPEELIEVLNLLIKDFIGVSCIEQRRRKRLSGRTQLEPLGEALARAAKLDPSRDLFEELNVAFNVSSTS